MPRVTTTHQGELLLESTIGEHRLRIDVPAAIGGQDRGPTPLALLATSLSACMAGAIAFYCARAGLDARDLRVSVDYELAKDPYRLTHFQVEIELPHVDVGARGEAIARVAESCPVRETMRGIGEMAVRVLGA